MWRPGLSPRPFSGSACLGRQPLGTHARIARTGSVGASASLAEQGVPAAPSLSTTEANIIAIEAVMGWNMRTSRLLAGVQPVRLSPDLVHRLALGDGGGGLGSGAAQLAPAHSRELAGVLCPWLPNTAAVRELVAAGFKVVGVECGAVAVERACVELHLGPEETGVHDGWTRHHVLGASTATSSQADGGTDGQSAGVRRDPRDGSSLVVYRGNPYLLTPPVLSLVSFPLVGVWDAWGLLVTPPALLPRYAGTWAAVLPRGAAWLAVAATLEAGEVEEGEQLEGVQTSPEASTSVGSLVREAREVLAGAGLHAHDLPDLARVMRRQGFAAEVLATHTLCLHGQQVTGGTAAEGRGASMAGVAAGVSGASAVLEGIHGAEVEGAGGSGGGSGGGSAEPEGEAAWVPGLESVLVGALRGAGLVEKLAAVGVRLEIVTLGMVRQ